MDSAVNIQGEFAKKSLLLLVGLALFGAPLSHKFYLFSSQQSFRRNMMTGNADHSPLSAIGLHDYHKCRLLSMDKRYDYKQTIGIFPFLILIVSPEPGDWEHYVPTDPTIIRIISASYLRGPPIFPVTTVSI
jgi:hypothetical protein